MKTENLLIKCINIELEANDQNIADNYPNSGFYIIENSKVEGLFYVSKENNTVIYIDTIAQIKSYITKTKNKNDVAKIDNSIITGDVLLKTIAMIVNNENYKSLK